MRKAVCGIAYAMSIVLAGGASAADLDLFSQDTEAIMAADWHSPAGRQAALALRTVILTQTPGAQEADVLRLAEACAREYVPGKGVSPAGVLLMDTLPRLQNATSAEREQLLRWLEEHVTPYLEKDPNALLVLADAARTCGQDPMPYLKAAAEQGSAEGCAFYASRFAMMNENNADEMQKWLARAAEDLAKRGEAGAALRGNVLLNLAESCEMKGGAFLALRGVCLALAFNGAEQSDVAYLLPAYYESLNGGLWKKCAYESYKRSFKGGCRSPYVPMRMATLAPEVSGFGNLMTKEQGSREAEAYRQAATARGYTPGTDYLHDFPHGYTNPGTDPSVPATMEREDLLLLQNGIENARASMKQRGLPPIGALEGFAESLRQLPQPQSGAEAPAQMLEALKKNLTEENAGETYYAMSKICYQANQKKEAMEYLLKAANAHHGDALYMLSQQPGISQADMTDLLQRAVYAGSAPAAYRLFMLIKIQQDDSADGERFASSALAVALAGDDIRAWEYLTESEIDPAIVLMARARMAALAPEHIPAADTALADYAAAHPETCAAVRTILLLLTSGAPNTLGH